jgi:hypothetical protein
VPLQFTVQDRKVGRNDVLNESSENLQKEPSAKFRPDSVSDIVSVQFLIACKPMQVDAECQIP